MIEWNRERLYVSNAGWVWRLDGFHASGKPMLNCIWRSDGGYKHVGIVFGLDGFWCGIAHHDLSIRREIKP